MFSRKWSNLELKLLPYVGLVVLKISQKFQPKWMFPSPNNQLWRKPDFLPVLWNMSIFSNRIIFRRKHPFALKLLGYSKGHLVYIWQKFQLKIILFTRGYCCWIWDFQNPEIRKKPRKSRKNPKIPNPLFPLWFLHLSSTFLSWFEMFSRQIYLRIYFNHISISRLHVSVGAIDLLVRTILVLVGMYWHILIGIMCFQRKLS